MAWRFSKQPLGRRDEVVAVVLGTRTTQAVWMTRKEDQLFARNTLLHDAPAYEKGLSRDLLAEHLAVVRQNLGEVPASLVLVAGMADSVLRSADLPAVELPVLRKMVRLHSRNYFQQSFTDYVFDCFRPPHPDLPSLASAPEAKPAGKNQTLVAGAKSQFVEELAAAAVQAGFAPAAVTLSQVSLVNAAGFQFSETFAHEALALLDIGFLTSTISVVIEGRLLLTRVVGIGGDHITRRLADSMRITYPVAESLKSVLPEKIEALLQSQLAPLAEELRTAIHFCESQHDKRITQMLVCGGSARSQVVIDLLQAQLEIPCRLWTPEGFFQLDVPEEHAEAARKDLPQLAAALGAAAAWLKPAAIEINLLAEQIEAEELRRRDPVRRAVWASAFLLALVVAWAAHAFWNRRAAAAALDEKQRQLQRLQKASASAFQLAKSAAELEATLKAFGQIARERFLMSLPLDALQRVIIPHIQVVHLKLSTRYNRQPAVKAVQQPNGVVTPAKPERVSAAVTLDLQAKDSGNPPATEDFIAAIMKDPYFQARLQKPEPIGLKDRLAPQVDPFDPQKTFTLFTIECVFAETKL